MIHEQPYFFGKYECVRTLYESETVTVHLAMHILLGHLCVLKRVKKCSDAADCLSHEAKLLSGLNHPGIPHCYDFFEDADFCYLVEEYISGENLEEYLARQQIIPINYFYSVAFELCEVLLFLHGQNDPVIYRDLKPEHIYFENGRVKLIDFGIAVRKSERNQMLYMASEGFAAPEIYEGLKATEQSDIYSIGRVLFFLLAKVTKTESKDSLFKLIDKCLKTNPLERTKSVIELYESLKKEKTKTESISQKNGLLKHVAVIGSREGIGCTHIAVSMSVCLNLISKDAIYVDHCNDNGLLQMVKGEKSSYVPGTLYKDGLFKGMASGWPLDLNELLPGGGLVIHDYGRYLNQISGIELEDFSCIIAVCSGKRFESLDTEELLLKFAQKTNVAVIFNYEDKKAARENALRFKKQMYSFPLDKDPFCASREKIAFVKSLLKRKGVI